MSQPQTRDCRKKAGMWLQFESLTAESRNETVVCGIWVLKCAFQPVGFEVCCGLQMHLTLKWMITLPRISLCHLLFPLVHIFSFFSISFT